MGRFYFHLQRNGERIGDQEGAEAPDLKRARAAALKAAAEMAAEELKMGRPRVKQRIIVADERGAELPSVAVEATASIDERAHRGAQPGG